MLIINLSILDEKDFYYFKQANPIEKVLHPDSFVANVLMHV